MKDILQHISHIIILPFVMLMLIECPLKALALDDDMVVAVSLPTDADAEDMPEIISIEFPTTQDAGNSVFDFMLDPCGLIYATDAMRYGGGNVEKGATVYFHNKSGNYDFSSKSDRLTVTNKSTVPVKVTITVRIEGGENVQMTTDAHFTDSETQDLFLAIVDDEGNEYPLTKNGEVQIESEIKAMPKEVYAYQWNENTQTYEYKLRDNLEKDAFDSYSFGLCGACNPEGDWTDTDIKVTVIWQAEPVEENASGTDEETDETEDDGQNKDETQEIGGTHDE